LVPEDDKVNTLKGLLPGGPSLVHNLAGLMLEKGLISLLPLVALEFQRLVDQQQGVERAMVTSAISLDEDSLEAIRLRLESITGHTVQVTVQVVPSIIGGFIAQFGDRLIDGSTRARLRQLRGRMIAGEP
jgi:F-type H+-transporting ATPase subunit delta